MGSGTSKIVQWCKEWGLPEPTYEEAGGSFVTVFHNPKPEGGGQPSTVKSVEKDFGESAEKVFQSIKANLFIKTHEIAHQTQLSQRTIENAILKLKKAGLLKRVGSDKGGYWEVHG